ncbi:hypothetical protein EBU58_12000 [bacterium]|nr:hypothetical protein [bacterium]
MTGTGPGSIFQVADWETYTSNNMVGPEFGMLFEGSQGAWDWYAGGTFTAAFNWQNNIYKGANLPVGTGADYLRSNFTGGGLSSVAYTASGGGGPNAAQASVSVVQVPPSPLVTQVFPVGQTNTTNSAKHEFTFAPIGEWRLGARYRLTKSISLNFGYTGMWMSQIARASTNTRFEAVVKQTARTSQNRTANLDSNTGEFGGGQTAVVDANNNLQGFEPNGLTTPLPNGWQRVPPTTRVGSEIVRNPQQYVEYNSSVYVQQTPVQAANEYVLTNGIDFGVEIKY